jgi:hypothetical protein
MKMRLALVALCASTMATAVSAAPASDTAQASVSIVAATQVRATRDLAFGTIAKPTSGTSTVTVASAEAAAATPTLGGGGNATIPTTGQAHAATFRLVGTPNQAISISNVTLSFPGAGTNLGTVTALSPVARDGSTSQLPADGDDDLFVGGQIQVSPTTGVATYNGTLSLTVDFN